jgi:transposase
MATTETKMADLPLVADAASTPTRSEAQSNGGNGRSTMRSVALDLGGKITFCEVASEKVVGRKTVTSFDHLMGVLGPRTPKARVAIEACREAWHIATRLEEWGHQPLLVDTTRVRQLGVGHHGRKTDRNDAEVLARAVEQNRIPLAHRLSPHRQALRIHLGVRKGLVETRAGYVTMVRSIARAYGVRVPNCETVDFGERVKDAPLSEELRSIVAPLMTMLEALEPQLHAIDAKLEKLCQEEPAVLQLGTTPGVSVIIAAQYVSVIDDPKRFRHAHQVESYLGLVPSEHTSVHRKLGSITKQGNSYLRALLVQGAWCILRSKAKDPLVLWAKAVAERRGKRVAVVAVARRLAGILWAMWKKGTVYDAEHLARAGQRGIAEQLQSLERRKAALARAERKARRSLGGRVGTTTT